MIKKNKKITTLDDLAIKMTEGFSNVNKRFDGIDKKFSNIDNKFTSIDKRFDGIDKKFDGIDKRFNAIEEKMITKTMLKDSIDGLALKIAKGFEETGDKIEIIDTKVLSDYKRRIEKLEADMKELKNVLAI